MAVAALPPGVDPADLARSDPDALRAAVEGAVPFLGFRVNRALDAGVMGSPEGRARAAGLAIDVIREHPNELVRDQYVMEVASRTRIDPERLRSEMRAPAKPKPSPKTSAARTPRVDTGDPGAARPSRLAASTSGSDGWIDDPSDPGPGGVGSRVVGKSMPEDRGSGPARQPHRETSEIEALRLLISRREEMLPWLHEVFFDDERVLGAYRALVATNSVAEAIAATDSDAGELLGRLVVEESEAEPDDVIDLLVRAAANRALADLRGRAQLAEDPLVFSDDMRWLMWRLEELAETDSREEGRNQLVAWLTQQPEERE